MVDVTLEAQAGQRAERDNVAIVPHLFSSPDWLGHMAGRKLANMTAITKARTSRGYSVKCETAGGNTFTIKFSGNKLETTTVDRQ